MSYSLAPDAWFLVDEATAAGESVVVTVVVAHTVHSPGTTGASHAITSSGRRAGTVGGGIMEARLEREGADWIDTGDGLAPRVVELHHSRDADGAQSGMICAGRQTNVSVLLGPADRAGLITPLLSALRSGTDGALAVSETVVEWRADVSRSDGDQDGRWVIPVTPTRSVLVVGGGHCGAALALLMASVGWRVDVVDIRPELRTLARLRGAVATNILSDYHECADLVRDSAQTSVVVMTADFPSDIKALDAILRLPVMPAWLGVMGSEAKRRRIFEELAKAGHGPDRLAAVRSPIGVQMKSDTPAEIAISVAAELLGA